MKTRLNIHGVPPCEHEDGNLIICLICSGVMVLCDGGKKVRFLTDKEIDREVRARKLEEYIIAVDRHRKEGGKVH